VTAAKLRASSFTLDGEAVVCGPEGVAVFDALHRRGTVSEAMLYARAGQWATTRSGWRGYVDLNFNPILSVCRHTVIQDWVASLNVRSNSAGRETVSGSINPTPAGEKSRTVQSTIVPRSSKIAPGMRAKFRGLILRSTPRYSVRLR
jgi:hypothetical protein